MGACVCGTKCMDKFIIYSKIYDLIETQLFGSCEKNKTRTTKKIECARTLSNECCSGLDWNACMHACACQRTCRAHTHTHTHFASTQVVDQPVMMMMMIIVMLNIDFCTTCCYDWYCVSSSSSSSSFYLLHSALNCPFLLCWPPCVCLLFVYTVFVVFISFAFLFYFSFRQVLYLCVWVFSVSLHKRDRYFIALKERKNEINKQINHTKATTFSSFLSLLFLIQSMRALTTTTTTTNVYLKAYTL